MVAALLLIFTVAAYSHIGHDRFVHMDDDSYVVNNPYVNHGLTPAGIVWAFTTVDQANWHPITWLSHMCDVQLFGLAPGAHHFTSVAIHAAASLLLLLLLYRLTGAVWQSAFVAALFALHPMHVESVAWAAERKDVLSAFFCFLTLLFYTDYVRDQDRSRFYLALAAFVLGLMSKPMLVTLPLMLLLLDYWPLERTHGAPENTSLKRWFGLVWEKLPFLALSFVSCLITFYAQERGGATRSFGEISAVLRLENVVVSYAKYLLKTVCPFDLAAMYPFPSAIPAWQVVGSLLLLLAMTAAAVLLRRRLPFLAMGWFWFLVTLLPVIGLIQVGEQAMADRYSYLPSVGLFIAFTFSVAGLSRKLPNRPTVLGACAGILLVFSAAATWRQVGFWHDSVVLFQRANRVTPNSYVIHKYLGLAYADTDLDAAIREYRAALALNPRYADAHNNLGLAYAAKGDHAAAIAEYDAVLREMPRHILAHLNRGASLGNLGRLDEAIAEFEAVLRLAPDYEDARANLQLAQEQKALRAPGGRR
ncbi:tetratricopeptide repeat protein [Geomesophilobacter sediminis]|uniref:Tetratricopeptide repeat protein n=1 Tax=Geomesophilobacter sediminis TaxID=2798584 RepID=A0A8J7M2G5_9BACT|nr:tetratricopeptide repeat protein [Geomesophilobacter sediminis]MBJ6727299.1 tetratricopeptide repeat protein [Geomesophilobacter sediminis]